jgi:hypothetical protein
MSKLQTRPLVREGAPQHEYRKYSTVIPGRTGGLRVGHNVTRTCLCPETETNSVYWAHLSRFHLKTEIDSSLGGIVFYIKDRTMDKVVIVVVMLTSH